MKNKYLIMEFNSLLKPKLDKDIPYLELQQTFQF